MKTKNLLTLLTTFALLTGFAKAEGDFYWQVEFTIENEKGQVSKGYTCILDEDLDRDSLNYLEYFKYLADGEDSFIYYKDRIQYEYTYYGEKNTTDIRLNRTAVSFNSIKSIRVDTIGRFACYGSDILNEPKLSDTVWMKKKPVKSYLFVGFLCQYHVFVHKSSKKVEDIIRQLEAKQEEYNNKTDNERDEYNMKIDEELFKLIEKLKNSKVVVLSLCTC